MTIDNLVKKIRQQRRVTQEQLAAVVDTSRQTIIAIEKGNYVPSLLLAMQISKFFHIPVEELFNIKK
jgi:putative transcriptional regulator